MSSLRVFCTLEELEGWIQLLRGKWDLACLSFTGSRGRGELHDESGQLVLNKETYRVFLFPVDSQGPEHIPLEMNSVKARDWGWVDVRPGPLVAGDSSQRLLLSEIHGEDFEFESVHPARFVRWLRRKLKSRDLLTYGVIGRNPTIGGEAGYQDIAYTEGALDLHKKGAEWAQFPDGRVVFDPI